MSSSSAYNPKFRRRKKHQGSTWTPENQPALKPDGAWCRWCKTRHGYMTMGVKYEKRLRNKTERYFVILWFCKKTGFIIEEMVLGRKDDQDHNSLEVPNTDEAGSD